MNEKNREYKINKNIPYLNLFSSYGLYENWLL